MVKAHLLVTPIMIYLLIIFSHISSEPFVDTESKRAKKEKKKKKTKFKRKKKQFKKKKFIVLYLKIQ